VVRAVLAILALLATVTAFGLLSGGYIFTRAAPVVFVAAGLVIVGVWVVRRPERPSLLHVVGLLAFAAFVAWTGLSVLWSVGPDLSWVSFDVVAFYLLVAVVCGVLPGGRAQLRVAAYGFALAMTLLAGYALLGKIAPDVVTNAHVFARLSGSIGYWNVLAALIAMAVPIGLEAASRRGAPLWLRGLVSSALVVLLFTFFFTFSRGGFVALGVALLVWFALSPRRLAGFASLALPTLLVAAVLWHVRHLTTLFNATNDDVLRTAQGHALARWVLVAALASCAAQLLVAYGQRRRPLPARAARVVGIALLVVLLVVPVAGGAVYFPRHGGVVAWVRTHAHDALSGAGPSNGASRLTSLGTSGRGPWYHEALQGFAAHPLAGSGAGTFRFTNYLYRHKTWVVMHSHSEWLNVLSELGIVGFVLFATAIAGLLAAAFGRRRASRADPERPLLVACQAAALAFVVHMSIDWDWDMAVITVAFLLLAGVAAAYVRDRERSAAAAPAATASRGTATGSVVAAAGPVTAGVGRPPAMSAALLSRAARVLVTGLVVLGVAAWALPYLSQRADLRAVDQASRGRLAAAAASARQASSLDPLAVDPLITLALVQTEERRPAAARTTLLAAVRLQPRNYLPYYELGLLELDSFGDRATADAWFRRALTLDPLDALTRGQLGLT
jgi:hypothetical protein